ncbi:MAG: plastocyanin/azurin family copper-binding protein [Candidatus Dormibacteraeota bacterium]|nr:plastocyanin/azurin family copper-binding protein [Candidatus Dormibacteraeota bacterium]
MDRRRWTAHAVAAIAMVAATVMAVEGGVVLGVNAAGAQSVQIVGAGTAGCASAYCFNPSQALSNRADTVTFTNASSGTHTVTRCTAGACSGQGSGTGADTLDSGGSIGPNGTYGHTFSSGGTYFYYCSIHGYGVMHGEVTVQPLPTPAPQPPPPTPTSRPAPTHVMTAATPRPTPSRAASAAATGTATPQTTSSSAATASPAVALTLPSSTTTPSAVPAPAPAVTAVDRGGRQSVLVPVVLAVLLLLGLAAGGLVRRRRRSQQ